MRSTVKATIGTAVVAGALATGGASAVFANTTSPSSTNELSGTPSFTDDQTTDQSSDTQTFQVTDQDGTTKTVSFGDENQDESSEGVDSDQDDTTSTTQTTAPAPKADRDDTHKPQGNAFGYHAHRPADPDSRSETTTGGSDRD